MVLASCLLADWTPAELLEEIQRMNSRVPVLIHSIRSTSPSVWRRVWSRPIQNVIEVIRLVGAWRCMVLITGETGTGKEIAARALHIIEKICRQEGRPSKVVRKETLECLCCHLWPGNVRQLENAVEMAVALSGDRQILYPSDFPIPTNVASKPVRMASSLTIAMPDDGLYFARRQSGPWSATSWTRISGKQGAAKSGPPICFA